MKVSYGQSVVSSATLRGVEALPVSVEVVVSPGVPGFFVVGLADAAVQEARERVKAALRASGFVMPNARIVVNLAPSDLRKSGSGFDLPVAVGILAATGQIGENLIAHRLFTGELSLDGSLRPTTGMLAFGVCAARQGLDLVCAATSSRLPITDLNQVSLTTLADLREEGYLPLSVSDASFSAPSADFADISGHDVAKRVLQIAAAGGHGMLMTGPPGSGKTLLASRLPSILPPLEEDEALEAAVVHSVAGEDDVDAILAGRRPFRKPHHSASLAGLVGGGSNPIHPGEISLAHQGVLFLDELPEFKVSVLQGIRQPLESGVITITRADGNILFPARFMLLAASNPCPCGYYGDPEVPCTCTMPEIRKYQARIGGPLLDRIDLHLDVFRIPPTNVLRSGRGTPSSVLREGVLTAREFASWRRQMQEDQGILHDAQPRLDAPQTIIAACHMEETTVDALDAWARLHHMSGRAIIRTLNVARTIADLDESPSVTTDHVAEAIGFRVREGIGTADGIEGDGARVGSCPRKVGDVS